MARELENAVVRLVLEITGAKVLETPAWLVRPGRDECRECWDLMRKIYSGLTSMTLPPLMRPVERRTVDLVFRSPNEAPRILEVDEKQHFNSFRSQTLRHYPDRLTVAFDMPEWVRRGDAKRSLEGGGFAKPKPPLFPGANGRHRQRAFRDALCDLLPPLHGYCPTLRIGHFEVEGWLDESDAATRMRALLTARGVRCVK